MISITLSSISNIRDLGDTINKEGKKIRKNCLIRSAKLTRASEEDIEYLKQEHNLSKVIDLRTFLELKETPDQTGDLIYRHLPIIKDFKDGITHENRDRMKFPDLADTYVDMVTTEEYIQGFRDILNEIVDHDYSKGSVLWHCSEGKDRCGMVTALVLMLLDVDEDTIMKDYLETNKTNVDKAKGIYDHIMESGNKEIAESVYKALIADERYLNAALEHMGDDYIDEVLKLDQEKIRNFKDRMLI